MMLNEYILEEIMKLPSDGSTSLFHSLQILKHYKLYLGIDPKTYDTIYKVGVDEIMSNPIDNEDIITLRNGNWKLSEDKKYLIRNMNEN